MKSNIGLIWLLCLPALCQTPVTENGTEQKVDALVAPYLASRDFSGSILIAQKGRVVFKKAYGMADWRESTHNNIDTIFRIGSISKQFTAAAMLLLEERGLLSTDDPITNYLPEFSAGENIRLHHLLSHTSGIHRDLFDDWQKRQTPRDLATLARAIAKQPLAFAPGERESYSNSGYILLAFIVEKVAGMAFDDFLRQNVFEPLGMARTGGPGARAVREGKARGYDPGPPPLSLIDTPLEDLSNVTGPGSLYSTVEDLWKWNHSLHETEFLSERSRQKMFEPPEVGRSFGLGVYRRMGRSVIGHDGVVNGFNASLERFVAEDLTIAYLSNVRSGALSILAAGLAAVALDEEYEPFLPPAEGSLDGLDLEALIGRYQLFPGFYLDISLDAGYPMLRGSGGYPTYLYPTDDGRFFYRSMYAWIVFEDGGRRLVWQDRGGQNYPADRVADP